MNSTVQELIQNAIKAGQSGDKPGAKMLLSQAVKQEPGNARAWYLLSQAVDEIDQAIYCLEQAIKLQPNPQIQNRLDKLKQAQAVSTTSNAVVQVQSSDVIQSTKRTLDDIGKQTPALQSYYDELAGRYKGLNTYEDAANWKSDAAALVTLFEQYQSDLEAYVEQEQNALRLAKDAREALTALKRLTASTAQEKLLAENIEKAEGGIASIDRVITDLLERGSQCPSSKAEQKKILDELRLYKKELGLEKRQVNESMRQIRTQARQSTVAWSGAYNKGFLGNLKRTKRALIRLEKERNLAPNENAKAVIEKLLIDTERKIIWASHFTGVDFQIEVPFPRCAYCGRRMESGGICPGCGSDRMTREL